MQAAVSDADDDEGSFLERAREPLVSEHTLSRTPEPARRCHDVIWLVIFLLYWAGMLAIGYSALRQGDYHRLIEGMDDHNGVCGDPSDPVLESRPFVYFGCLQYGQRRPTVCMSACPSLSGHYVRWYNGTIISCDTHGRSIPATTYPTTQSALTAIRNGRRP